MHIVQLICFRLKKSYMEERVKKPSSRVPIIRENVRLDSKPPPPAHVHRIPPSTSTRSQSTGLVTLMTPRSQAKQNLYVEAPVKTSSGSGSVVIDSQPVSLKRQTACHVEQECEDSIICQRCKRCRCSGCRAKRELPKHWCGTTEVSAQCVVEWCTCLKAVKCCFDVLNIHDHEHENPLSDRPCACFDQPHCCKRWTCMGLMSICLPCLCFYPFLKCGLMTCTACYNCATRKGCTCSERSTNEPGSKRLIEHENSSST